MTPRTGNHFFLFHFWRATVLVFVIVLLAAWLIVSVIGFAIEGLIWLGIVGVILFVGTAAVGAIRRRSIHR
jgi:hypothetical protein